MERQILITGGAGFIGSHVVNHFSRKYPNYRFIVMDSQTYASNIENIGFGCNPKFRSLKNVRLMPPDKADIRDKKMVDFLFAVNRITDVIHLAAESHVDNSIENPDVFVETNVLGTLNLLNAAKRYWKESSNNRFYHISTDEVYGDLKLLDEPFTESTPYNPSSPYSASKASSDHFVRAYGRTYGLNIVISNCSNNYGPHQHSEKLIPVVIDKLIKGEKIPVYGTGTNIRDWLWVGDHVNAIDEIFHYGKSGETYNIGGDNELTNIQLIKLICHVYGSFFNDIGPHDIDGPTIPIEFVADRKGHDLRYAVNSDKLQTTLGWQPLKDMEQGLKETIEYYVESTTT